MNKYVFQKAQPDDVEEIFRIYVERVRWMDANGIRQWNVTGYLERYPIEYYMGQCNLGNLYILKNTEDEMLAGAVVLYESDERWKDCGDSPAYYIHNLVTNPAVNGAGAFLIDATERLGKEQGKRFIRLDCAVDNPFLNGYYASKGYRDAGFCEDGSYKGIRREKKIN
ncbi:GNAT family N-acetyltransferase [Parabacteroides distasonis]|uniref:GNAT family N-acetyltransferase n=1 Tax=Parabacteroides distasonis TaxID=823 RepID=UPI001D0F8D8F|nr:GNAT family N-acetyltransferase [Parabacteroides distasonis]MCC2779695.1 GNAT family N-acetyltransferase [Parabacteroides distasonis]MCQ5181541.1 GNAT family N-acetyltransferase [Parabacteroides distasonis]WMI44615.1 GNAT family N-acetyltransferase [Parabacteroides distasonis]